MIFIGIDLAGSENRETGICFLDERKNAHTLIIKQDKQIIEMISKNISAIKSIGIDAPLSLPKGRENINSYGPHFRACDIELKRLKIKFFPITLGPMRKLTERGIKIKNMILKMKQDITVAEVFPGALYDIFGVNRKSAQEIMKFFKAEKIKIKEKGRFLTQDELDSIACAYTMYLFEQNKAQEIGDRSEGTIIIPSIKKSGA